MLEYCVCPKCERMIMLDGDLVSGFCCYCGTHILFSEARDELLAGLRSSIPDAFVLEADLSELIDEEETESDNYGFDECREKRAKAQEYLGKWDFTNAFKTFSEALDYYPNDFESRCGLMTAGVLRLKDTENWERYLSECVDRIRGQSDWNMAQAALEYTLDIMKKFLSKGGRYVSPSYTIGFFEKITRGFPALKQTAAEIVAHCLNIEYAPYQSTAGRLDHETTRFAVGNTPAEPDKNLRRGMLLVIRCHCDMRVKMSLCRALYVIDRAVWLRSRDMARINDALLLCEAITSGEFRPEEVKFVLEAMYDFLMMGDLEPHATEAEKIKFLSTVYSFEQVKKMERFFSGRLFFNRLYLNMYLMQRGASASSAEYKRIKAKIEQLSNGNT